MKNRNLKEITQTDSTLLTSRIDHWNVYDVGTRKQKNFGKNMSFGSMNKKGEFYKKTTNCKN